MEYTMSEKRRFRARVSLKDVEILASILSGGGEEFHNRILAIEREVRKLELLVNQMLDQT